MSKIFPIAFCLLLVAAFVFAINPIEQLNQRRDENLKTEATTLVESIQNYFLTLGKLPWADELHRSYSPPLAWTKASDSKIGVCSNTCEDPGSLIKANKLNVNFISNGSVKSTNVDDLLYVAKGSNSQDQVYVCFLPKSQKERNDFNHLFKVNSAQNSFSVRTCSSKVTWTEDDVCYWCTSR